VVDALRDQITDLRQQVAEWEQSSANWQILYQQTKAQLAEAEAEVTDLRTRIGEYENCISWNVTCKQCAHYLDDSIREHERADRAEAEVTDLRARLADPAATTERWQQLARDARDMRLTDPAGTYIMPVPE
jgi:predicted  nucleic acid-binding Zn-ribbon protein